MKIVRSADWRKCLFAVGVLLIIMTAVDMAFPSFPSFVRALIGTPFVWITLWHSPISVF